MILTKWIENVGYMVIVRGNENVAISAESPLTLGQLIVDKFDHKKHDVALGVKFEKSDFVLFLENYHDIPLYNVFDPCVGKYLIKYGKQSGDDKCLIRLD